ncbi:hypothetical protein D1AOALGA4SA_11329, partial [Olavius algarvensis Delta 1 endosymbiont]
PFASVWLGLDFARYACHNIGQHHLAAGQCPAHNNFMERDGLLPWRFSKLVQENSFKAFMKWGAGKPPAPHEYVMRKNKIIKFIIPLFIVIGGCTPKGESIIEVGMEFEKAEEILKNHGAQEQILQMAPPKSPNGGYMKLINYGISKNKALTIIHDEKNGKNIIVKLGISSNLDQPKNSRDYTETDTIDLKQY